MFFVCTTFDQANIFSLPETVWLMSLFHVQRRKLQHLILASETFGRDNLEVKCARRRVCAQQKQTV